MLVKPVKGDVEKEATSQALQAQELGASKHSVEGRKREERGK
jgi:hypothetical protein